MNEWLRQSGIGWRGGRTRTPDVRLVIGKLIDLLLIPPPETSFIEALRFRDRWGGRRSPQSESNRQRPSALRAENAVIRFPSRESFRLAFAAFLDEASGQNVTLSCLSWYRDAFRGFQRYLDMVKRPGASELEVGARDIDGWVRGPIANADLRRSPSARIGRV